LSHINHGIAGFCSTVPWAGWPAAGMAEATARRGAQVRIGVRIATAILFDRFEAECPQDIE
jgi:hypothetical protein